VPVLATPRLDAVDATAGAGLCDRLEWDSAFFARPIARYRQNRCTAGDLDALSAECAARRIACVYILISPSDTESVVALTRAGALAVDVRLVFAATLTGAAPPRAAGARIRAAAAADLPHLERIAAAVHHDTRFHADPHFARERCMQLYVSWIARSCRGYADRVLVAEADGVPVGYVTCHADEDGRGRIGLCAVAGDHQRRGIGSALVEAARDWCASIGLDTMTVATQQRNHRAVRAYERAGLMLRETALWFHYWPQ
jgi:dTDP-4-amino-4,6-dideoxy-D-galactose acyltransferase